MIKPINLVRNTSNDSIPCLYIKPQDNYLVLSFHEIRKTPENMQKPNCWEAKYEP